MNKLIIFGTSDVAEIAKYYFDNFTDYKTIAFCVDKTYLDNKKFLKLPVFDVDEFVKNFKPNEVKIFIALGYAKLNEVRKSKYEYFKRFGYKFASYISPHATILNEFKFGDNCFILENNIIQPYVKIGNNVTLWSGNHIGHHSVIKDHCFIASQVVISGRVIVDEQCFFGVNSTIRDNITIGKKSMIGAGSLILSNVVENSVFKGIETQPRKMKSNRLKKI